MARIVIGAVLALALGAAPAFAAPALGVDAGASSHPISPEIYGMNFADETLAGQIGLPVDRFGGNSVETYNYVNSFDNTASDYYYENIAGCFGVTNCSSPMFPDQVQIRADRGVGAQSLIALPLMGYVAKDSPDDHPFTCGYPKTAFATQDSFDQFDSNCGDGLDGGARIDPGTPTRDGVAIGPSWDGAEVAHDVSLFGTAADGGVAYYELGNEPGLWSSTHEDMHFARETNTELISKFEAAGAAVRAADPSAKIVGPSEWGWTNYFCDDETLNGSGTCSAPWGSGTGPATPVMAAFLKAMHDYQQSTGTKVLDDFDLHYYQQGFPSSGPPTDVTRSLWDPTYVDPSWINSTVDLIPRMRQWVADNDPGVGLSLSEYNMDLDHTLGDTVDTLLEADTLGIFAREGLDLATEWGAPSAGDPEANAFRLYRDYDGHGARFGDAYLTSTSSNQGQVAIYAARRTTDGALTIALVNKTSSAQPEAVAISNFLPGGNAQVWQGTAPSFAITRQPDASDGGGGVSVTLPAQSLTMLVVPSGTTAPPPAPAGGNNPGQTGGAGQTGAGDGAGQTGAPGSRSAPSSAVRCHVPTLTGHTLAAARTRLAAEHCALGTVHREHSRHRSGRVYRQSLKPNTTHARGAHVSLWLSLGRAARPSSRRAGRAG